MMQVNAFQSKVRSNLASGCRPETIPTVIRQSCLMKRGGFDVFEGLVDARMRREMLSEAVALLPHATRCEVKVSDDEEVRGGKPRRRFINAQGGPLQQAFNTSPAVLDFLRGLTTRALTFTGEIGTYSYYMDPGDYLDIHRDIVTCDVAVITSLHDRARDNGEGGRLCLYPERLGEPLSQIRATPDRGAVKVRVQVGQTIVLYGGIVPHALLPVAEGQARIVSVLCYRAI
jgi:hypothetical protein